MRLVKLLAGVVIGAAVFVALIVVLYRWMLRRSAHA
jgi:hypothetical protein